MQKRRLISLTCLATFLFGLVAPTAQLFAQTVYVQNGATTVSNRNIMPNTGYNPNLNYQPSTGLYATPYGTAYSGYGATNTTPYLANNTQNAAGTVYDPRYERQYGQRFNPEYYGNAYNPTYGNHTLTQTLPSLIGAGAGAMLGAHFGFTGILVGGAVGYFLGRALGNFLGGNNNGYYNDYYGYQQGGGLSSMLPGIAGGVLGVVLTSGMGPMGMILGGAAGYFLAKTVGGLIFPQTTYGGQYYNTNSTPAGYYSPRAPETTEPVVQEKASETEAVAAPETAVQKDLETLRAEWLETMGVYKDRLTNGGTADEKEAARKDWEAAQDLYFKAKALR